MENNERLEFLGDAVVHAVLSAYLYKRFEGADEGALTRRRNRLASGEVMIGIARSLGLERYLRVAGGEEWAAGQAVPAAALEDAFEAVVGAAFLEAGFAEAERWVVRAYETHVDMAAALSAEVEPKDRLWRHLRASGRGDPVFSSWRRGRDGFEAAVRSRAGHVLGVGSGSTRHAAENAAARAALEYMSVR